MELRPFNVLKISPPSPVPVQIVCYSQHHWKQHQVFKGVQRALVTLIRFRYHCFQGFLVGERGQLFLYRLHRIQAEYFCSSNWSYLGNHRYTSSPLTSAAFLSQSFAVEVNTELIYLVKYISRHVLRYNVHIDVKAFMYRYI